MAFNGSGVFQRLYNWVNDAAAGINISSTRMDAEMDGMATGLSNCITKDGQTTITANIPMATYKFTGLGQGTVRTDSVRLDQVQDGKLNWVSAGGTSDAITASYSPAVTTLVDGQLCYVRAGSANTTTTPTFSPNGLTARVIVKKGGSALSAGDIVGAGHELILRYNLSNTRWELLNPHEIDLSDNNTFSGNTTFQGKVSFEDNGELTISSGAITATGSNHTIDTEGDASSDDLDTINGGADGFELQLRIENASRAVVIKDGTGNIETPDGEDITLDSTENPITLRYDSALSKWLVTSVFSAATATATTTSEGVVELSTDAEVKSQTSGVVPTADQLYLCPLSNKVTAYINSDATIAESENVSSITDNATADHTVNYSVTMASAKHCAQAQVVDTSRNRQASIHSTTATSARIFTSASTTGGASEQDFTHTASGALA